MAPPRTYRCESIILSYTPLDEADLLVTMYTRDRGKSEPSARARAGPLANLWVILNL